jgi:hypothetical protein
MGEIDLQGTVVLKVFPKCSRFFFWRLSQTTLRLSVRGHSSGRKEHASCAARPERAARVSGVQD